VHAFALPFPAARPADRVVTRPADDAPAVPAAPPVAAVDLTALDSDALAARAAAGDAAALGALVARYHGRALRFAANMGLAREDAEEAVQDAFVRAAGALPRFRPGAPFEPWLFRILSNRCRTLRVRTRRWRGRRADAAILDGVAAPGRDPLAQAAALDQRGRVLAALERLPADQREAFLLKHVEGLDYTAMTEVTGAGESALKMRVKRACDALRALLAEDAR
jgi:RNA polymerase sigma-70 factor (ECF subfamily)